MDEIEIEIEIGTISPTSSPEKPAGEDFLETSCRLEQKSPCRTRGETSSPRMKSKPGDLLSPSKLPAGQKPPAPISELSNSCRKLTVADRMLEKLGMQMKKGVQGTAELTLNPEKRKTEVSWPLVTVEDESMEEAWIETRMMNTKADENNFTNTQPLNTRTQGFRDSLSNIKRSGFDNRRVQEYTPGQDTLGGRTKSVESRTSSPRSKSQHSRQDISEERRPGEPRFSPHGARSKNSETRSSKNNGSKSSDRRKGSSDGVRRESKLKSVVSWDKWKRRERTSEPSGSTFVDNIKVCS